MASYIVHEKWHSEKIENAQLEAERIVDTCAKLLKEEIREQKYSKEYYPSTSDIRDIDRGMEFLTPLMRIFIETMITNDIRRNSIGQALIQAVKPSSIMSPILFGTGVEMDHVFGSKWLIDELFRLGFSVSYDEVTLFKQSILQEEKIWVPCRQVLMQKSHSGPQIMQTMLLEQLMVPINFMVWVL